LHQTSKPTYYGPFSYEMHVGRKKRVEEPPKFVASCKPQAPLTCDKKNFFHKVVRNRLECKVFMNIPACQYNKL